MLFNSYVFVLLFLPVTLLLFFRLAAHGRARAAIAWLVMASLFYYGWWNPVYLGLIVGSMLFNYLFGRMLARPGHHRRLLLWAGIGTNLALLGYYKYANFLLDNAGMLLGAEWSLGTIVLPLGISFFTFQQIAYLVDAYRGETREYNFLHYCLFVTFFPQLIAGPIVHHREMLPQFREPRTFHPRLDNLAVGITIFAIGLSKKVLIADSIAHYATPVFSAAQHGAVLTLFDAWSGALAYTFQLYFDFSAYSDMAIGLARMFGIRLPINFYSPYKANNIIDFWRRWHITLSRFLRDYLYIPLGGNRKGPVRRYLNLLATMLLGGLWHGAGWTFVLWGGLHGLYLCVNHLWRAVVRQFGHDPQYPSWAGRTAGRVLTFLAVVVAWVFFRADSYDAALAVLRGMAGMNGVVLPDAYASSFGGLTAYGIVFGRLGYGDAWPWLLVLLGIAWYAPNTLDLMRRYRPALNRFPGGVPPRAGRVWLVWRPNVAWMLGVATLLLVTLLNMGEISEFLYFQF